MSGSDNDTTSSTFYRSQFKGNQQISRNHIKPGNLFLVWGFIFDKLIDFYKQSYKDNNRFPSTNLVIHG